MVNQNKASESLVITVPEGSSVKVENENGLAWRFWNWLADMLLGLKSNVSGFTERFRKLGLDDPRKVIHCIKVGLALALVSAFYYSRPLYDGVGGAAMWAVMTIVVIFEFTVGGCLYKGFNRTTATLSAGALACGIHWLASKSGETMEQIILGASIFLLSSAATFSRFIVTIKAKFDYGVLIFILTFNLVAVSSYRVDNLIILAQKRISTIAIGVSICLIVSVVVFPVWAGEDLHLLIIQNMEMLADSLQYSVNDFFLNCDTSDVNKSSYQKSQGYKSVLNSKASEDSLANLAKWEPSHGLFRYGHPWNQYLKVGAAMRFCAYNIEALNSFIHSEIQVPGNIRKHLSGVCTRLSSEYSQVLRESANSLKTMKLTNLEMMMAEMNDAVEEVHSALRCLQTAAADTSNGEERKQIIATAEAVQLMEVLPLISIISLLMEISGRIEGIADAVEDLTVLAGFPAEDDEKQEKIKPSNTAVEP